MYRNLFSSDFFSSVVFSACALTAVSQAYATNQPDVNELLRQHDNQRLQSLSLQSPWQTQQVTLPSQNMQPLIAIKSIQLDDQRLQAEPELLVRALSAAVLNHKVADVVYLLPLYQALPQKLREPLLQDWANAIVLESQGKYTQASAEYTHLLESYPQIDMLRLRLANVLFANKQYTQAQAHYHKLMAVEYLPKPLYLAIERQLQNIKTQENWQVQGGGNFLNDKNINNSPKNRDLGGGWTAPEPQSAQGVAANAELGKKWFLDGGFYAQTRNAVQAKYYWSNKGYNEATARLALGVGHQDARHDFSVMPFVEKSWYADGHSKGQLSGFSTAYGVAAQWQQMLHPRWQSAVYAEISRQDYQTRQHLDGVNKSVGAQVVYHQKPERSWFFGVDYQKMNAQAGEDSFIKKGVKAGVMQAWQNGLATRLSVTAADKAYQQAGFFGEIQHNTEYSTQASLWNQRWQIHGITPRLTWQYQKTASNLPLYRHDKQQIFVEFAKQF